RLGFHVVITVRHPAAFASSLKRLEWPFDFNDLLKQPLLMQHWLEPFRSEIEKALTADVISQASLLWKIIYQVVEDYHHAHPEFILVRHEELSLDPLGGFGDLFKRLGLDYNTAARQAVQSASSPSNPGELPERSVHAYRLNSQANLTRWKERLTVEDVERVREITGETAAAFYPDLAWD
ncbi:MAG: hypothetical protein ACWGO1_10085, partial [Anaerolineales bacterium]